MVTAPSLPQRSADFVGPTSEKPSYRGLIVFACFVALALITIALDGPPRPLSEQAPLSAFSAARAMKHLSVIARAPHPVNSAEHDAVRDYILGSLREIGLTPQVQRITGEAQGFEIDGALENIVCRLQGSSQDKAILLVAHYDSVAAGPGASDDGAAVAALLETARALKSLPQLKRDIILLFTDGEETHLRGARAFVAGHPWAKDVGIVLNFEARGVRGPSIMFETSDQNGWLISHFGQAASYPVANSLSYEIYKRMPNDTDFTVFRRAGYSGLNFAFIDGLDYYHSKFDSIENIEPGSLQHHGDYMLELAREFGNTTEAEAKSANVVYFDILGMALVRYSHAVGAIFLGLAAAMAFAILFIGVRAQRLHIGGCMLGLLGMVAGVIVTVLGAWIGYQLVNATHSHRLHFGLRHHPGLYTSAFCTLGLACAMALYAGLSRKISALHLLVGSCFGWLALTLVVSWYFPGGTYVFLWPMLFSLIGALLLIVKERSAAQNILLPLSGIPAIVIIAPLAHKIFWAFGTGSVVLVSAMVGLVMSLLIGQIGLEHTARRWLLPTLLASTGLVLFVAAIAVSRTT
jgi:peptidase M28-like protein